MRDPKVDPRRGDVLWLDSDSMTVVVHGRPEGMVSRWWQDGSASGSDVLTLPTWRLLVACAEVLRVSP